MDYLNDKIILDKYIVYNKQIGSGSYSTIYLGRNILTDKLVAVKCINFVKNNRGIIDREINIMKKLNHNNILKFLDKYDMGNKMYVILEYCEKGDLINIIPYIKNEETIRYIFMQIVTGIKYLKKLRIIHRDLKPQNILINKDNIIKICDFGFANEHELDLYHTICGSPHYMAPEILKYKKYTNNVDLWSLGIILYHLCYKKVPFDKSKNLYELVYKLSNEKIKFSKLDYSYNCIDLLQRLLIINPNKRISWDNFFEHTWINNKIIINQVYLNTKLVNKEIINTIEHEQKNIFKNTVIYNNYFKLINNRKKDKDLRSTKLPSKPISIKSNVKQIGKNCYNYITNSI